MGRRRHQKSRAGCRQCKQRHVRCDEQQPSCMNCSGSHRVCSYLSFSVVSSFRPRPDRSRSSPFSGTISSLSSLPPCRDLDVTSSPDQAIDQYSPSQLELIHHFEHGFVPAASMGSGFGVTFFKVVLSEAGRAPYLLDQVIALSAAHKGAVARPGSNQYSSNRAESIKLQTRALTTYRKHHGAISTNNCLPIFLFSSLLGQQILYETLSYRGDLSSTLDRFAQCFALYRGIRSIAEHSWPLIQSQFEAQSGQPYPAEYHVRIGDKTPPHGHFSQLHELVDTRNLDSESSTACHEAIAALQRGYEDQRAFVTDPFHRAQAVHEWAVHVPPAYVEMLRQRAPEALVILATYGVLIHNASEYWSCGDAAEHLIGLVTGYLGSYWAVHLEWPNRMLLVDESTALEGTTSEKFVVDGGVSELSMMGGR